MELFIGPFFGLVIVLILIFSISIGAKKLGEKYKSACRALFNTDTLAEGIRNRDLEVSSTPKSISAMTSLFLPQITRDFPSFHYEEMRERANNVINSYLSSIDQNDPNILSEGSSELQNQLSMYIDALKNKQSNEHFDSIQLHRTEISNYSKQTGRCVITFQVSLQYFHYIMDLEGKLLSGDKELFFQSRFEIDAYYIQDRTQITSLSENASALNCPNCGAPLTSLGEKKCAYCGSPLIEINMLVWNFCDVRQLA